MGKMDIVQCSVLCVLCTNVPYLSSLPSGFIVVETLGFLYAHSVTGPVCANLIILYPVFPTGGTAIGRDERQLDYLHG